MGQDSFSKENKRSNCKLRNSLTTWFLTNAALVTLHVCCQRNKTLTEASQTRAESTSCKQKSLSQFFMHHEAAAEIILVQRLNLYQNIFFFGLDMFSNSLVLSISFPIIYGILNLPQDFKSQNLLKDKEGIVFPVSIFNHLARLF